MLDALVFDFDGLILDTETPLYESWRRTYERHAVEPISFDDWSQCLGLADDDPNMAHPLKGLVDHLGSAADVAAIEADRRKLRDQLLDVMPLRPGVQQLLDQAAVLDIPIAIASSSRLQWVETHLGSRGLLGRFEVLSCRSDGTPGKPHPATYLGACERLGADPARSVALEDSPNGVRAAKAAGMYCIAVPAGLSADLDFGHADHTVASLELIDLTDFEF